MKQLSIVLKYMLAAAAVFFLLVYAAVATVHLQFPFALEWIEGSVFQHVHRVLSGRPLYVSPSAEFVPAIYPPLYFYIAAAVSRLAGFGFTALRLVSCSASAGFLVLIFCTVRKETGSPFSGLFASGLMAATYMCCPYFDLARVDSLFLFFFLAAAYIIKFNSSWQAAVLAGLLAGCATLTKQTGILLLLPLLIYCLLYRTLRITAACAVAAAAVAGVAFVCINAVHDGWFAYYIMELPKQHPVVIEKMNDFWINDIAAVMPAACLGSLVYFFLMRSGKNREQALFYSLLAGAMVAMACLSRLKSGGFTNVLMPAYAALSILFGLSAGACLNHAASQAGRRRHTVGCVVYGCGLLQMAALLYSPFALLPDPAYARSCRGLVHALARIEGRVFAPAYGYLCILAGKEGSAHIGAINDILRGKPGPVRKHLIDAIGGSIRQQRFRVIMLDRAFPWFDSAIKKSYVRVKKGAQSRIPDTRLLKYLYIPRTTAPTQKGTQP